MPPAGGQGLGRVAGQSAEIKGSVVAWLRREGLTLAIALTILWLALQGGAYAITVRSPLAIAVWSVLGLGLAVSLWPRARPPRYAFVAGGLLAAFGALNALSMAWADSAENAFTEFNRVVLYLGVFAVVVVAAKQGSARRWSDGLAIGILAVGLVALGSRLFPSLFGPSAIEKLNPGDPRLSYPVNYWNGLAVLVALGFPLTLRMAVQARSARVAALAITPLPALGATIYLTSSRGGLAACVIGVAAFVWFTDRRLAALAAAGVVAAGSAGTVAVLQGQSELVNGPLRSTEVAAQGRTAALLIVLICALTAALYAFVRRAVPARVDVPLVVRRAGLALGLIAIMAGIVAADPASRLESLKQPPQRFDATYVQSHLLSTEGNGRWQFWQAALDQFESRPVLGGGAGSYEAWWAQHGTLSYFTRNAHSLFLETLGELGAGGFLLVVALVAAGILSATRRLRATTGEDRPAVAALFAAFLAFVLAAATDWVWDLTVVAVIGIVLLGLLTGPATCFPAPSGPRAGRGSERRRRLVLRASLALASLALVIAQAVPLVAELKIRASERALKAGDATGALTDARAARSIQGWAASPHLQVALVEEQQGRLGPARESIARAIDRDPSDWRLWAVASRIENRSGLSSAARESFDRARSLNPRSPLFRRPPEGRAGRRRDGGS